MFGIRNGRRDTLAKVAKLLLLGENCETCQHVADQPHDHCYLTNEKLPKKRICEHHKK